MDKCKKTKIFAEFQVSLGDFENSDVFLQDLESIGSQGGPFLPSPIVPELSTYSLPFFVETVSKSVFLITKCSETKYCKNSASTMNAKAAMLPGLSLLQTDEFEKLLHQPEDARDRVAELLQEKGRLEPKDTNAVVEGACREPAYKSFQVRSDATGKEEVVQPGFQEIVKKWQREISEAFASNGSGYLVLKFKELFVFDELQKMYDALGAMGAHSKEFDSLTTLSKRSGRSQTYLASNRRDLYQRCGIFDLERDLSNLITKSLENEKLSLSYTQIRRFTAADPVLFSTFHPDHDENITMTLALWGNGTFIQRDDGVTENADFLEVFLFSGTRRKKPTIHAAPNYAHDRLVMLMRFNP